MSKQDPQYLTDSAVFKIGNIKVYGKVIKSGKDILFTGGLFKKVKNIKSLIKTTSDRLKKGHRCSIEAINANIIWMTKENSDLNNYAITHSTASHNSITVRFMLKDN